MTQPCPHCGFTVSAGMNFCSQCGQGLTLNCTRCGTVNHIVGNFCGQCGNRLIKSDIPSESGQPDGTQQNVSEAFPTHLAAADRRQISVLFCDLKDSVKLSRALDAEEYRELLKHYRETCDAVFKHFGGTYPRFIGDGIRVYFGFPQAHEDDAERAVRTGLELIERIKLLNNNNRWNDHVELAVRVGVATGQVIASNDAVDEAGNTPEAIGVTPSLAARVQALADTNTLTVTDDTKKLLGKLFDYADLDYHQLKGFSEPVRVWQVVRALPVKSRFAATRSPDTPFVGREEEIDMLLRRWEKAKTGEGQVVLLAGEAGIGKSRITRMLYRYLRDTEAFNHLHCQCSPYHSNSMLYPIIDMLERDAAIDPRLSAEQKLEKLTTLLARSTENTDEIVPLLAALLSIPISGHYPPLNISSQRQKEKTFNGLVEQMRNLASERPLLVIFEDAHWIDPTTLELLDSGVQATRDAQVMIVITFRPEFPVPWVGQSHVSYLLLNRLSATQSKAIVEKLAEKLASHKTMPVPLIEQIIAKTEGVPLFVEELTKTLLDSELLTQQTGRGLPDGRLPSLSIPTTLQDSLMARLDQLKSAKAVAQLGAVIGREFAYDLLALIMPLTEPELKKALNQLVEAEVVNRRGIGDVQANYRFRHALLQEAAYDSLLHSQRQELHAQVGQVLEQQFPELWEGQPELLAHHYSEAGMSEQAIAYWFDAGKLADEHSAHQEAVSHFRKALELLETLAETDERKWRELDLLIALGPALIASKGLATLEVSQIYARALMLCSELPESSRHFAVLWGWSRISSNYPTRYERAERMLALAQRLQNQRLIMQAYHSLWTNSFHLGQPEICYRHIEQGLTVYEAKTDDYHWYASIFGGHDAYICAIGRAALSPWLLGYPQKALDKLDEMLNWAKRINHLGSNIHAMDIALLLYHYRQDTVAVHEHAEKMIEFAENRGFPQYRVKGLVFLGDALTRQGELEKGIEIIREQLAAPNTIGSREHFIVFSAMLAEAYAKAGLIEKGLHQLDDALAESEQSGLRFWDAELYRCMGVLFMNSAALDVEKVETCLQRALTIADRQKSKSLALRAAVSLAQWQQRHNKMAARNTLKTVYDWFNEGFDTVDMTAAKRILTG